MSNQIGNSRSGFTLVEVLVAMVMMGVISAGLGKALVASAQLASSSSEVALRAATVDAELSRVGAIPEGALPDTTVTATVTGGPFPHVITTVSSTSGALQTVTITVTPTRNRAIGGIVRTITRRAGSSPSPFQ